MLDTLPPLSFDLIEELDRIIPLAPPSLTDDDRKIWYNAGRRSVVQALLHLKERMKGDAESLLDTPLLQQRD